LSGLLDILKVPLNECLDITSARNTFKHYFELIYFDGRKEWLSNCPVPCEQTVFDVNLHKYHENNNGAEEVFTDELVAAGVMFLLRYDNFVIEKRVETLIFDTGNFLAQAGGTLGLFLGFSCLSLLLALINFLKKITKYKFCEKGSSRKLEI